MSESSEEREMGLELEIPEPTYKSRLEEAFAGVLEEQRHEGLIRWYRYEPMKLNLAPRTTYTPDFLVVTMTGQLEMYEVKGYWRPKDRIKTKIAAALFPFMRFKGAYQHCGNWHYEEFKA